jgi:hypothetical protein
LSRSSLLARRALALRLEKLPHVAEALGAGQIGVEAAVQVGRVAVPSTQAAWVERARQRTINTSERKWPLHWSRCVYRARRSARRRRMARWSRFTSWSRPS